VTESPTKRKPTQSDVARRAAVSQAMVSYVLNDHPAVSVPTETRRRILDAVAELGYVPNSAARSLRTSKTLTIAAIIPDITNPYYPAFIRGV
jgi:LacI family transcriptional regulator